MRKCWKSAHTIPNKIRYLIRHTYCVLSFDALLGFGFDLNFSFVYSVHWMKTIGSELKCFLVWQWPLERIRIFFHICFLFLVLVCIGQTNANDCLLRFTCVSFNIAIFQAQWFRYSFDRILNRILVLFQYIVDFFFSFIVDSFRLDGHFAASQHTMNQKTTTHNAFT